MMDKVPIVDLLEIGEIIDDVGNDAKWKSVAGNIRQGLGSIGFVYLINHGIYKRLVYL